MSVAIRSTDMLVPQTQPKQFPERDPLFEARAKRHLMDTHSPETLLGLDWNRPEVRETVPVYVHEFRLNPLKRTEGQDVPCPLCRPNAPKFLHGALVWYRSEGVYRCIGWDCAARYCGAVRTARAISDYRASVERERDFDFLERNLGHVPAMLRYFEALLIAANVAENLRRKLSAAHVREMLRHFHKENDGRLRVWDVKEVERYNPVSRKMDTVEEAVAIDFGPLDGEPALSHKFDVTRSLRVAIQSLSGINHGEGETASAWVIDYAWDYFADMRRVRKMLHDAGVLREKLFCKIAGVLEFFAEDNFKRLAAFAQDQRNTALLYASVRNGTYKIGHTISRVEIMRPDFSVLSNLPPWPVVS